MTIFDDKNREYERMQQMRYEYNLERQEYEDWLQEQEEDIREEKEWFNGIKGG